MQKTILSVLFVLPTFAALTQIAHFEIPGYTGLPINGGGCWEAVPIDLEGDGDLDIIVLRAHEYDEIYINDGQGGFTLQANLEDWQIPGGSFSCASTDLNGDGYADLVLGRGPASGGSSSLPGHDMILIHDVAAGGFTEASANLPPDEIILGASANEVNYTMGVATGDFNLDGIPDLVMVNGGIIYQIQIAPIKPLDGAWNNLLFANFRNEILENNLYLGSPDNSVPGMPADGVFDFVNYSDTSGIGVSPDVSTDVAVGDFNGDGLDDIFVTNFYDFLLFNPLFSANLPIEAGFCKLYLNDLSDPGHFGLSNTFPQIAYPATSVAASDFDQDGDLDLFVTMEPRATGPNFIPFENIQPILFLNDGSGNFTPDNSGKIPVISGFQQSLYDANFIDINGDGWDDIFCAGVENALFIQDPVNNIFFDASTRLPSQNSSGKPYSFHAYGSTINDFNGDGLLDIIMVDTYEQNRLQTQDGDGNFTDVTTDNLPPDGENNTDVAIADLDGDGDLDIVACIFENGEQLQSVHIQNGAINGYPAFNDLSGIFSSNNNKSSDRGVEIFDLNNDGFPEVLFTGYNSSSRFFWNNKNLDFTEVSDAIFPGLNTHAHINKAKIETINTQWDIVCFLPNGTVDAVGSSPEANALYKWNGTQFENTNWIPADAKTTATVDFADLNNDGWKDILVVNENDKMEIYLSTNPSVSNPNYTPVAPASFVQNHSVDARFVDLEGDGDWDILENNSCCAGIVNQQNNKFTVYINQGVFTSPVFIRKTFGDFPFQGAALDVLDLNDDGNMDVVLSDRDSLYFFRWNPILEIMEDRTSSYTDLNSVSGLAMSTSGILVVDINNDGLKDIYLARDNQDLLLYGQGGPTAVSETGISTNDFKINYFPNPFQNDICIFFELKKQKEILLSIYDLTGKIVYQEFILGKYGMNKKQLNLATLPNGVHVLKLQQGNKFSYAKIIKAK